MTARPLHPRVVFGAALVGYPLLAGLIVAVVVTGALDFPDDLGTWIGGSALLSAALTAATVARRPGRSALQRVGLVASSGLMTVGWAYALGFALFLGWIVGCPDGGSCRP